MTSNQAIMKRAHAHQHIFSCVAKRYALTTECHKINGKSVHVHDFFFVCAWSIPLLMHIRRIQYIFVSTSPRGLLLKLPVSRCRMHPSHTTERQTYSRLRVLFSAAFLVSACFSFPEEPSLRSVLAFALRFLFVRLTTVRLHGNQSSQ